MQERLGQILKPANYRMRPLSYFPKIIGMKHQPMSLLIMANRPRFDIFGNPIQ